MRRSETTSRLRAHADRLHTAWVGSDVDLFFDPADPRFSLFGVMAVRDEVEALLGRKADVMTRNSLHPYLRSRIEAEALQVF